MHRLAFMSDYKVLVRCPKHFISAVSRRASLTGIQPAGPLAERSSFEYGLHGDFTPVLAKHTKSFNLADTLSVGVDRIQRNFEPMQRQVES